jgi:negative regulator of sigma E activity
MDGDLPPDQARFLLRRMEHDTELTGCWERWQLCGDALRGQAQAPAPAGFADRISAAIAAEPLSSAASPALPRIRSNLAKWGGGALAASVAVIALFMVRQQVPDEAPSQAAPALANQSPAAASSTVSPEPALQTAAAVTAASVAVASVPRRQSDARRSATRNQQTARNAAAVRNAQPDRAVASAALPVINTLARAPVSTGANAGDARDPFSNLQINAPAARPWPRAVLPQYSSGSGAFNADYSTDRAAQTFYPFEPRLPVTPPVAPPEETTPRDR